jgi:hypothetical protein
MLRLSGPAARVSGGRSAAVEVGELPRDLLAKAMRERRFKPRAARIDSTVVEADVRYRVWLLHKPPTSPLDQF